jgi:protein O-mannosyl-transferase
VLKLKGMSTPALQPRPAQVFESAQKRIPILCLLLIVATLVLYSPAFHAPFLNYDDAHFTWLNPEVRSGITRHSFLWALHTSETANWHPVTWLSHELDSQLFGTGPTGPHMVNVFLHALNAALLFLILASATRALWRSLVVATLFALHPINVESVAWIAERKNVLSMFFFLLALAAYGWYARKPDVRRYLAVTVLYALALMSKPQVITFPFALLLLDYWPLRRIRHTEETQSSAPRPSYASLVLEKLPWFLFSAVSAVITMKVQTVAMNVLPLRFRLANAAISYVNYLAKAFWPTGLAPMYPHPGASVGMVAAAFCAILLAVITAFVIRFREDRYLLVGWLWFLGTLVPMIGLVQVGVQSMADRYAYIPLLGIFVIVCWGGADLVESLRVSSLVPATAASVVLLALAFALHRQVGYWGDNFSIWQHTLDVTQKNFIAEDNVGTALIDLGKTDEAIPYFRRAKTIDASDPISTLNLATYAQRQGDYMAAIAGYEQVLQLTANPVYVGMAYANQGYSHYYLKQYDRAREDFAAAIQHQPGNPQAWLGLGLLAQRSGDLSTAVQDYARAAQGQPSALAFLLLGQALESSGQKEMAGRAREQATQLTPDIRRDEAAMQELLGN